MTAGYTSHREHLSAAEVAQLDQLRAKRQQHRREAQALTLAIRRLELRGYQRGQKQGSCN